MYESLNNQEQERFVAFTEACSKQPMKKKLQELIFALPGPKLKVDEVTYQVINSAVKSHASQLIELAKKIQIEEIKQRLATKFPHPMIAKDEHGQVPQDQQFLVNGICLSKKAQQALVQEMRDLGACQPHHMQEARRQLNMTPAAV